MKVLLSAYACEPNYGSEPGVGWRWALELAKLGYEVFVVTREMHKEEIEKELAKEEYNLIREKMHFFYYDISFWRRKRGGRFVQIHYILWQIGIVKYVKPIIDTYKIDILHHVTFGVFRHISFLAFFNKFFIFGPVGGGERVPFRLRRSYTFKGFVLDLIRDLLNCIAYIDPLLRYMYKKTDIILCKNEETKKFIPSKFHYKTYTVLEVGSDDKDINEIYSLKENSSEKFKLLFVGRLVYLKGVDIAIRAFKLLNEKYKNTQFVIVGDGKEKKYLLELVNKLQLSKSVLFVGKVPYSKVKDYYIDSDLFVFPSLHDSSGNVLIEALSAGLPVLCLNIGGPGVIVDSSCGIKINVKYKSYNEIVQELGMQMIELYENRELLRKLSKGALERAKNLLLRNNVEYVYNELVSKMKD